MADPQELEQEVGKREQLATKGPSIETQISHLASDQRTEELAELENAERQRFMTALLARDG